MVKKMVGDTLNFVLHKNPVRLAVYMLLGRLIPSEVLKLSFKTAAAVCYCTPWVFLL